MPYKVYKLQNVSEWSGEQSDVVTKEDDPKWDKILETWKSGKPPTDSIFWKRGVFALTKQVGPCRVTMRQMVCLIITWVFDLFKHKRGK